MTYLARMSVAPVIIIPFIFCIWSVKCHLDWVRATCCIYYTLKTYVSILLSFSTLI